MSTLLVEADVHGVGLRLAVEWRARVPVKEARLLVPTCITTRTRQMRDASLGTVCARFRSRVVMTS